MNSKIPIKLNVTTTRPKRTQIHQLCVPWVAIDPNNFQTLSNNSLSVSKQLTTLTAYKRALVYSLCLDTHKNIYIKIPQPTQACMRHPKDIRNPSLLISRHNI